MLNNEKALELTSESLNIYRNENFFEKNPILIASMLNNIGVFHENLGNYEMSLLNYMESLEMKKKSSENAKFSKIIGKKS